MGIGATAFTSTPVAIAGLSNISGSIALGATRDLAMAHTMHFEYVGVERYERSPVCAAKTDGTLHCWGGEIKQQWWNEVSQQTGIKDVTVVGREGLCFLKDGGNINCTSPARIFPGIRYSDNSEYHKAVGRSPFL